MEQDKRIRCFAPVADENSRVLVLGIAPSAASLQQGFYYAHPRNAFWPILFDVFGKEPTGDYEKKKALIRDHGLALWDAAAACWREGSLDSNMRDIVYSDFGRLYADCPHIHTVLCNGGTAHALFMKSGAAEDRRVIRMPSTSPAYTMVYAKKLAAWKGALLEALSE